MTEIKTSENDSTPESNPTTLNERIAKMESESMSFPDTKVITTPEPKPLVVETPTPANSPTNSVVNSGQSDNAGWQTNKSGITFGLGVIIGALVTYLII